MSNFKIWDTVTIVEWWAITPWSMWWKYIWKEYKIVNISTSNFPIILDLKWAWSVCFNESEVRLVNNNMFYTWLMYNND